MTVGLTHYLVLSAVVFACGVLTILLKRNAIAILIGVELVLNAATLNLVAFNRYWHGAAAVTGVGGAAGSGGAVAAAVRPLLDGQVFALFVIVIAAAEAAVALAIILNFYNNASTVDVERANRLKG